MSLHFPERFTEILVKHTGFPVERKKPHGVLSCLLSEKHIDQTIFFFIRANTSVSVHFLSKLVIMKCSSLLQFVVVPLRKAVKTNICHEYTKY